MAFSLNTMAAFCCLFYRWALLPLISVLYKSQRVVYWAPLYFFNRLAVSEAAPRLDPFRAVLLNIQARRKGKKTLHLFLSHFWRFFFSCILPHFYFFLTLMLLFFILMSYSLLFLHFWFFLIYFPDMSPPPPLKLRFPCPSLERL